jgi:shikimate 5-dehydrogenase
MGVPFGGAPDELAGGGSYDILAHATPVGFHDPDAMLVPAGALRRDMVVFDAVPMPVETRLLREAKFRGCATVPGVRMQLHQAARQFELYTGVVPDLTVMERALLDAMEQE